MNKLNGLLKYFLPLPFYDRASNAKSVVLKLGSAVLLGSAKQFYGTAKHIPKNQNDAPEERKILYKKIFRQLIFPNQT